MNKENFRVQSDICTDLFIGFLLTRVLICSIKIMFFQLQLQRDGYNLPSHDALTQILPNYHRPVKGAKTKPHHAARQEQERAAEKQPPSNKPIINHTHQIRPPHTQ